MQVITVVGLGGDRILQISMWYNSKIKPQFSRSVLHGIFAGT